MCYYIRIQASFVLTNIHKRGAFYVSKINDLRTTLIFGVQVCYVAMWIFSKSVVVQMVTTIFQKFYISIIGSLIEPSRDGCIEQRTGELKDCILHILWLKY
jgi:hypothetical protein